MPDQYEALLFCQNLCSTSNLPQIGLVAVLVTIPAIAAAPRWMYGLDSAPAAAVAPLCVRGTRPEWVGEREGKVDARTVFIWA
jgi:hypothetical protein